jgi:hypothetical protein
MAADPFNSKGGYTVGIPPIQVIDANGNITAENATFGGNVAINGNGIFTGNIYADTFNGTFNGNISGNLVVPGSNTWVLFNDQGNAGSDAGFVFDSATQVVTVTGEVMTNRFTMGTGTNEFSTLSVVFGTTNSASQDQTLHSTVASSICSIDYTIIATDPTGNNRQTSKLFASILGTEVGYHEIGTIDVPYLGPGVGDFKVTYDAGYVLLTVTPVTSNLVNYKIMVTSYKE